MSSPVSSRALGGVGCKRRLRPLVQRPAGLGGWRLPGMITLAACCWVAVAYAAGRFLIVEHPREPAQAIVVLAGGYPTREWEAASLFRSGLASRVVLVREWLESQREAAGVGVVSIDERHRLLVRFGVPAEAIMVAPEPACMTSDELLVGLRTLRNPTEPVILVTSKYHTRRVDALWRGLTASVPRAIIRTPTGDPFPAATWWLDRRYLVRVAREYLGLLSARLPLPQPKPPCGTIHRQVVHLVDWLGGRPR